MARSGLGLATFGLYSAQWGYLMAVFLVVIAPIVVLFFFAQKRLVEDKRGRTGRRIGPSIGEGIGR